jgi:hypothetical protein
MTTWELRRETPCRSRERKDTVMKRPEKMLIYNLFPLLAGSFTDWEKHISRAADMGFTVNLVSFPVAPNVTTFTDKTYKSNGVPYFYRVMAVNEVGTTQASGFTTSAGGAYPTMTASSLSNIVAPPQGITFLNALTQAAPTKSPVVLTWTYTPSGDQTGFTIQRATNSTFSTGLTTFRVGNVLSFSDTTIKVGITYYYRVMATNMLGNGIWSNTVSILTH